ncbi:carbohydrate-binding protein [Cohnella cholangitidis]|uniref:CBM21 domain-containing protein n=1 Tax=Cohnella cholangitidis TaxID=2598458 RepID=A0A7G5C5R5_9BACL|nr:carbohydrate-binding protein [Cohnella cholangitidis]QMV44549.1 hypothetical protein FPL14_27795 [Cohnella cholangitidis]
MKAMKKLVAGLMMFAVIFGVSFAGSAFAAGNEVKLIDSHIFTYKYGYVEFSGNIEVENLGYAKEVVVHYTTDNVQWHDINANYVGPTDATHEKWKFLISTSSFSTYHPELQNLTFIKFAIQYKVNGNIYWDNNGGADYNNVPYYMGTPSVILGKASVLNGYAELSNGTFSGTFYVKNLSPTKTVKVRYTTDNWATYQEGNATYYSNANPSGTVENWKFNFSVPGATEIKYALSLTANGQTYWDNNYGNNFVLN